MVGGYIPCTNSSFWSWRRRRKRGFLVEVHSIYLVLLVVLYGCRQVIKTALWSNDAAIVWKHSNLMAEYLFSIAANKKISTIKFYKLNLLHK